MIMKNTLHEILNEFGSQHALASQLGVSQQTVSRWIKLGVVPPRKVLDLEKLTGIPRHQLNPIIYPPEN